ncbi:MAG: SUMF1/EgtB/PvdO family nonheme iron enzyme [Planctomycetes bacterium]|nr:SUMF1/EgtB/PvdO family nonheme iron enzyme [Planctomycetota bacterium]
MAGAGAIVCEACRASVPADLDVCPRCATPVPGGRLPALSQAQVLPQGTAITLLARPTDTRPLAPSGLSDAARTPRAPGAPTGPLALGTLVDGKFGIVAFLGAGGFGTVYRVQHCMLRRDFALKVLLPSHVPDPQLRERFFREARILMDLQHPSIVPVREVGEWRGLLYMVLDYCPGETLAALLKRRGRLGARETARLGIAILRSLEHAHGKGFVHRDLKPANLILAQDSSARWDVKVLDFGIAKVLEKPDLTGQQEPGLTSAGALIGTLEYMSTEQAQGQPVDARSDLFSLGALLHQAATGRRPFEGQNPREVLFNILLKPPPTFVACGTPDEELPGLEALLARAMSKLPSDRPTSARAMRHGLEGLLEERRVRPGKSPTSKAKKTDAAQARGQAKPAPPEAPHVPALVIPLRSRLPVLPRRLVAGIAAGALLLAGGWLLGRGPRFGERTPPGPSTVQTSVKSAGADPVAKPAEATRAGDGALVEREFDPADSASAKAAALRAEKAKALEGVSHANAAREVESERKEADAGRAASASADAVRVRREEELKRHGEAPPGAGVVITIELGGGVKLDLVPIPAGDFPMGSEKGGSDERPVHEVTLTRPFELGKFEVTQEQWQAVMGANPSHFKAPRNPVEQVSWEDCQRFVARVNQTVPGGGFRLPTEAEWEYACRAGGTTEYSFGDDAARLGDYSWFDKNSGSMTHPVGQKRANTWGLCDMHGNVWEWCSDGYDAEFYGGPQAARDPSGPVDRGASRVLRGGSWNYDASGHRAALRFWDAAGLGNVRAGVRVARSR